MEYNFKYWCNLKDRIECEISEVNHTFAKYECSNTEKKTLSDLKVKLVESLEEVMIEMSETWKDEYKELVRRINQSIQNCLEILDVQNKTEE